MKDKDNELQVELNKISTSINTLNTSVTLLNQAVNPQVVSGSSNIIKEMYTILNAPSGAIRQESLELGTIIGKNIEGNDVTVEDIIDEPIIISYYEDGQEIYFYGLLNEKLNWDGYCIFNVYKNDALISINESLFLNGQRENYKTLSRINDEVWLYNERECYDDVNIGNTIKYSMKYEKNRDFDTSDVKYSDIVYINSVVNVLAPKVLQYYSGNTTNEKYNDDSGKAYLIDYFEDGTVKTIYQGCFENGLFNDTSGNAWYITKDTNTNYMYYKGPFVNGEASDKSGRNFKNDLAMKEINEYIASLNIEKTLIFDAD